MGLMIKFLLYISLFYKYFCLTIYSKFAFFYVDDYIEYISSSEGIFYPKNPTYKYFHEHLENYIFYFNDIKHDLEKELCIQLVNLMTIGSLAFKYAFINEYDVTILNYENFYHCDNCNLNTEKRFTTKNEYYEGSPIISTSNSESLNTFCLKSTNDISIFYINENKINQNFYKGNILKYILNSETDIFNIDNLFIIDGKENYIFDLNAVSLKIRR